MKIAKKVLATVMALAMIVCLSAMAFAATPKVVFEVGEITEKGTVDIDVYLVDAVGATAVDFEIVYAKAAVTKMAKKAGQDAKNIGDVDNAFSSEFNQDLTEKATDTTKTAAFAGYFKNENWSSADWADADGADAVVNGEKFHFVTITVTLADKTQPVDLTVSGNLKFGNDSTAYNNALTLNAKKEEPTSKKEEESSAKKEEESSKKEEVKVTDKANEEEKTTAAGNPNTGDKNTGDNMALAAAAGVVALAGAAFIISKKRK